MKKISGWYNKMQKIIQLRTEGMYDTFGMFRKDKVHKRLEHKRARRYTQQQRFYEGFEEFLEENRKKEREEDAK